MTYKEYIIGCGIYTIDDPELYNRLCVMFRWYHNNYMNRIIIDKETKVTYIFEESYLKEIYIDKKIIYEFYSDNKIAHYYDYESNIDFEYIYPNYSTSFEKFSNKTQYIKVLEHPIDSFSKITREYLIDTVSIKDNRRNLNIELVKVFNHFLIYSRPGCITIEAINEYIDVYVKRISYYKNGDIINYIKEEENKGLFYRLFNI